MCKLLSIVFLLCHCCEMFASSSIHSTCKSKVKALSLNGTQLIVLVCGKHVPFFFE